MVNTNDRCVSNPQQHMVMRSTTILVLLFPEVMVHCSKDLPFEQDLLEECMEFIGKLPGNTNWVLSAESIWDIVHCSQIGDDVMGFVFGTAEREEESRCAKLPHHTPEFTLFYEPELCGTTHSLKHGAQIGLQVLIVNLKFAHYSASRHCLSIVRFQDVVHTG